MKLFLLLLLVSAAAATNEEVKEEEKRANKKQDVTFTQVIDWLNKQKQCGWNTECSFTQTCVKKVCVCAPLNGYCTKHKHCCSGVCKGPMGCACSGKDFPCRLGKKDCCASFNCVGTGVFNEGVAYGQCVPE